MEVPQVKLARHRQQILHSNEGGAAGGYMVEVVKAKVREAAAFVGAGVLVVVLDAYVGDGVDIGRVGHGGYYGGWGE